MKLWTHFKSLVRKADCFPTTELFRYKAEAQYRTFFGGFVSIGIITILVLIFYAQLIACFYKDQISATEQRKVSSVPTSVTLSTYPESNFMFAVELFGDWFQRPERYFDVTFQYNSLAYDPQQGLLQPCTDAHWDRFPEAQKRWNWSYPYWLCFPLNISLILDGAIEYASNRSSFIKIQLSNCENSTSNPKPCAPQAAIDLELQRKFYFTLYFINPSINPSEKQYINYYLDERTTLYFSKNMGVQSILYVEDYQIQTDDSIISLPIKKTQIGPVITEAPIPRHYEKQYEPAFVTLYIGKSPNSRIYKRYFLKIQEVFALIGGLFSTITTFVLIISAYNNSAYEISLASSLFKPQNEIQLKSFKNYSFFSFLKQTVFNVLQNFGCSPDWKSTVEFNKCQKQMEKQLDVQHLLNRILYLETALSTVLDEHQQAGIHLRPKLTIKQAYTKRKAFKLKRRVTRAQKTLQSKLSVSSIPIKEDSKFTQIEPVSGEILDQNQLPSFENTLQSHMQMNGENLGPTEIQNNDIQTKVVQIFIDSESDASESEKSDEIRQIVLEKITKLKEEASNGNTLSKKIWDITGQTIKNILAKKVSEKKSETCQKNVNLIQVKEKRVKSAENIIFDQKYVEEGILIKTVENKKTEKEQQKKISKKSQQKLNRN